VSESQADRWHRIALNRLRWLREAELRNGDLARRVCKLESDNALLQETIEMMQQKRTTQ
jgi:hypothetical protein